jgi:hypothetical protein
MAKGNKSRVIHRPYVEANELELTRLRHQVTTMRESMLADLNDLEAQINALLPRRADTPITTIRYDLQTLRSWAYGNKD